MAIFMNVFVGWAASLNKGIHPNPTTNQIALISRFHQPITQGGMEYYVRRQGCEVSCLWE